MDKSAEEKFLNKDIYQVFLVSSKCSFPLSLFTHSWFVLNEKGKISRWELYVLNCQKKNWGKVHCNFLPPFMGISYLPYPLLPKYRFKPVVISFIEGSDAQRMSEFIKKTPQTYSFRKISNLIGPNSNTYIQWILDNFPNSGMKLPWNAYGKRFALKAKIPSI